ncbi:MAG: F0F1 ATP synthase subunit A [Phenylobacterium sp.]|uniref:F0F1 ATP synthase subunit A n=1 Tax=Phenylobacterium sp. TaxID=1871053 RepID=UPI002733CB58|nr:F0F1 ATP synthase subunit A [Phenylobacterium sp.]MBW0151874.1 F0F1 ATP synthase subunit A [Phenylobacterium sp.]MDP1642779.1 F0F1 ATP synthase subunit A [Phenylobacterium sp.]MDP3117295.1 F0F1 ATP synthase subunit A [Phenylobacterium sp.]MDZ4054357.1 F0F1 ATP synthase subunit A [Phenylobacterium sp.]MDZ4320713.1 F0F1 ATP synthase subunit A [Phenylobacterium sp.]
MADPMHQFEIQQVLELPAVAGFDLSITNSALWMIIAAASVTLFFAAASAKAAVVPGRLQSVGEMLYELIHNLTDSIIGHEGKKYFPFVFTLFAFILAMNLLGMVPYFFTSTSQLAVTATLGLLVIAVVIAVGFARNGLGFFKLFVPSGVPFFVLPLVVVIEVISFLVRPVTLALRLFGNMVGGHVVLKVFGGFVVSLGALGALGIVGALVTLTGTVAITALEFMVAFLQAFVFAVLACVYLNDVVNLHSH